MLDLVVDIKHIDALTAKRILQTSGNRTIDPISPQYISHGISTIRELKTELFGAYNEDADPQFPFPSKNETVRMFEFLPGVTAGSFLDITENNASEEDKSKVHMYIHVLITLCIAHMECEDSCDSEALADAVLSGIGALQNPCHDTSDNGSIQNPRIVLDDDIDILLRRMDMMKRVEVQKDEEKGCDMSELLGNSKIADLANEVASDIDIAKLLKDVGNEGGDNNTTFDFSKLTQNTNLIGEIVSNVGAKIQNKLASGELNQQDLMKEALSLMASFNGGAGMGGMGGMGGMAGLSEIITSTAGGGKGSGGRKNSRGSRSSSNSSSNNGFDMGNMMAGIFKTMSGMNLDGGIGIKK
jgi:hypothetical protein